MKFISSIICGITTLHLCLGERYFTEEEAMNPNFDVTQLELIESYEMDSPHCPGQKDIVSKRRIPIQWEDGTRSNETAEVVSPRLDVNLQIHYLSSDNEVPIINSKVFPYASCLDQENPLLEKLIKENLLDPPSTLPYNLKGQKRNPIGDGQPAVLDQRYFHEQLYGGFFIEAGAVEGEFDSTTLYFEQKYGWSGLLVEPIYGYYHHLLQKNRKVWSTASCLSPTTKPTMVNYNLGSSSARTVQGIVNATTQEEAVVELQCFPLYAFIKALGNPRVDYLSLDVEGAEMDILKTIPWDKVEISSMSIETQFVNEFGRSQQDFVDYLAPFGYLLLDTLSRDSLFVKLPRPDLLQVKNSRLDPYHSPAVTMQKVLTRRQFRKIRLCIIFNVKRKDAKKHCMRHYPLDYYREMKVVPECINEICNWDLKSILATMGLGAPWKTTLEDTCWLTNN